MASRSARRSRKLPGNTSTFCSSPPLIIRQSVARLTPSSFADAVIPRSRGPVISVVFSRTLASRMPSIAQICSGEAANNRFNLSSVFMCSPIPVTLHASKMRIHTRTAIRWVCRFDFVWVCCREFFSSFSSTDSASTWLGAWFLVRSSFSSISDWRFESSWYRSSCSKAPRPCPAQNRTS